MFYNRSVCFTERIDDMAYHIGIDGGGSKTRVAIIDELGVIAFMGEAGPSSIDTVSPQETIQAITGAYRDFMIAQPDVAFTSIFIGIGGIVSDADCETVESWSRSFPGVTHHTLVRARNDMENALYSGLLFDQGIALICGTGSVAFGKNRHGESHKAGGWGFHEGDLGSAYDLGMRALRHVIQALDGRDQQTEFSLQIANAIGIRDGVDFFHLIRERYLDRTWIAGLAPLVTEYALKNDPVASKIVDQATTELAKAVRAVKTRLNLDQPEVVVVGSLGHAKGYKEKLHENLRLMNPGISISSPKVDPAEAAARMAKHLYDLAPHSKR
jgi:glucosamine kinase